MKGVYSEYCTGCGLCKAIHNVKLVEDMDGFEKADIDAKNIEQIEFCKKVCPAGGALFNGLDNSNIWGSYENVFLGYSKLEDVRFKAASGGVISALAIYLLESKRVDGIIHIGVDEKDPLETKVFCSRNRGEIMKRCGSRYITSSPLININKYLKTDQKYAFIGRPCDVESLKSYIMFHPEYRDKMLYTLTFFCAGAPSKNASKKLIKSLGCSINNCKKITYRGNGWPGFSTIEDNDGNIYQMEYIQSWNKILGRDVRKMCRFCMNGIGDMADISSGDLWYLNTNKKPDFTEQNGRNVVFARTKQGLDLIQEAIDNNYIYVEDYEYQINDLKSVQVYQYIRRVTMLSKILAMKLFFKKVPYYNINKLNKYTYLEPISKHLRTFLGTAKRVLNGKLT